MRRNFWFFVVLMSSFTSLVAQEVDVTKLTADTKTFIFSDGKHTVKNYIYERLQAQTNCCGQDRIYLEIKIDPSGYVLQVKALTGKNDCYKESVIDVVKNIKWDASDFSAPKSIYFEVKPEVGCDNGKENKYAKLATFNNPKLDPNGVPTTFASSTGVPSTQSQPATPPATTVVTPPTTPPATTVTPPTTTQPTKPEPSTVVVNTPPTTTVTPPVTTQPATVTPPPTRPQPINITQTPEFQNAVAEAVKQEVLKSKMEDERKRQEEIAKLRAALDKQIADEEKARKEAAIALAKKEEDVKKKAEEDAKKAAEADKAKGGKGKTVDFGIKEDAPISPEELAKRAAEEARMKKDLEEADAKAREAEKIAKMSPIERLDYEHAKRIQDEEKRARDMETKLQNELAGLESKKREAEAQQRALEEAKKKQELEAQRAADDIAKKKNEVIREKDNTDLAKIDAEKKLAASKKGIYEQEAKKREEEMKRLQAELEKQQAEVQKQLEAIKIIEDKELAKKQEAALHAVAANNGAPIETTVPAPVTTAPASKVPLDTAAINTLMQQNDVLRKQLYYLQQQLDANKRGNTNISIQTSPTVSGVQMNRPNNDGYKIDYQAPSKTEVALPDNKNANIQRDMGDQQDPKKAQPAKPATPAKTATPAKGTAAPAKAATKPATEIVVPKKPVAAEGSKPEATTPQPEAITVPSSEAKSTYVSTGDKTPEGTHLDTYKNTEISSAAAPEYVDGTPAMKTYIREKLAAAGVCGLVHLVTELNVDKSGNVVSYKILKGLSPDVEQKLPSVLLGMKFKTDPNAPHNQPVYIEFKADVRCAGKTAPVDVKKVENYINR
ncbi:MAG: hypothetical protein ACKVTZ_09290 [Bacteroidia bacterium]